MPEARRLPSRVPGSSVSDPGTASPRHRKHPRRRIGHRSDLDAFDLAILDHVQQNNAMPLRELAGRVNLSPAAVSRRLRVLTGNGVIAANVAIVDPAMLGGWLTIIAEVDVADERLDLLEATRKSFADEAVVQQCYYVTGDVDFVLVIVVPSMTDYEALTQRLFFGNKNVKRFRTLVVMDSIKANLSLPLAIAR